jgi:uncharacterized delta-60 repeat protein
VQVTAADPMAAQQGTINLNVKVTGKGFKNGARAQWFITGTTNPGGITVNSTAFVSSSELTANITVTDTAAIANFDIAVTNTDGRGGKGTELFAVTAKGGGNAVCSPQMTSPCPTGAGCLDATFNGIGQLLAIPGGAHAIMAQPDGKLVVAGEGGGSGHIFVARYNTNGAIDTGNFGDPDSLGNRTGITTISIADDSHMYFSTPGAIYIDASGNEKILAAGYAQNAGDGVTSMFIVRLNENGSMDTTFGDIDQQTLLRTGKKLIQINTTANTGARSLAAQLLNGVPEIVVVGYANGQGAIFKLKDNGDLDTSFNGQGYINLNQSALSVMLQVDGKILAGGGVVSNAKSGTRDFALTRLTVNGQVDPTFGLSGQATTDFFGQTDDIYALAFDSTGKIIAGGNAVQSSKGKSTSFPALARYSANGQFQIKSTVNYGAANLTNVVIQSDGKIVVLIRGTSSCPSWYFALTRFNPSDLTIDTSFGSNGTVTTSFGESGATTATATAMAIQIDPWCACQKIVVGGNAETSSVDRVALARFVP